MSEDFEMNTELSRIKEAGLNPGVPEEVQETVGSDPATEEVSEDDVSEDELLASDEDTEDEPTDSEPVKQEGHRSKAAEKRIAKLVKEREQLKGQLALYQSQPQTQQPEYSPVQAYDPNFPSPDNYPEGENDIDYRLDVREYQRAEIKKATEFQEKLKDSYNKYPDLPELIEADQSKTNATMVQLIKDSNVATDLFYYLMANPDISNKIAAMSPTASAREMGKIEMRLEEKVAVTKPTTPAKKLLPPPITPVKSTKAAVTSLKQSKYSVY